MVDTVRATLVASECNVGTLGVRWPDPALVAASGGSGASGGCEAWVSGVRFALLGTLTVADGAGDPVAVAGARQRALLAGLLLSANAPVSSEAAQKTLPQPRTTG